MFSRFQTPRWRQCRRVIRRIRINVLLVILVVVAFGVYCNRIGLPNFVKQRLLAQVRAHGVDLQFSRLRLRYYRGIVAENVRFGPADAPEDSPSFSAREVELKLDHEALKRFKFNIDAFILHNGQFVWPLVETNRPARSLSVDDIQTKIQFLPDDRWELDNFSASFAGAKLRVSGAVTNASAIPKWPIFQTRAEAQPERLQARLRALADALDRIKFSAAPELTLAFHGDGRDPKSFDAVLNVNAAGADTPWGTLTNGYLITRLSPPSATNREPHADFVLYAHTADTPWAATENFHLHGHATIDENQTDLMHCRLELQAERCATRWAQAADMNFSAEWDHSLTNAIPVAGQEELRLTDVRTHWGTAREIQLDARRSATAGNNLPPAAESWGWWARLQPYLLDWNCRLSDVEARDESRKLQVKEVACSGNWRAPMLTITNLHSELYQGQLNCQAALNVATRALNFSDVSDFDAQQISPLLTETARHWLGQFSWATPPRASGQGGIILPAWTDHQPDWRGGVLPTLWLQGDFSVGAATYRGLSVVSARSHILYSNMTWRLPDLVADRPEGKVYLTHWANDRTLEYYFHVQSGIDLKILRPLLEPKQRQFMDELVLTQPPLIDAEIWGRWHDHEHVGVKARVAATNFTFRGESASLLHTDLSYTNHYLQFSQPRIERDGRYGTATSVSVDFDALKLFITNGFSTLEPMTIIHPIGAKVTSVMEPYHFLKPPTVHVNGVIGLEDTVPGDVRFEVDGGPFHWMKFNVAHVSGSAHWFGSHLTLSGIQANFYQGRLTGTADFDFTPDYGADFSFDTFVTNADLRLLIADVYSPTNHLEGKLSGHLNVTQANSEDWNSWFGRGEAELRNGLIWEIPIFGIFSPILDGIVPGLGKARASEGSGTFIITNSVIRSDNLVLNATALRMKYAGTVDFKGRTDAIVEAELLRNTLVVGPVVQLALWPLSKLFKYNVTGTLSRPKMEPRYVPKALLMPLHPFRSLREMFVGDSEDIAWPDADMPATNTPPPVKKR